MTQFLAALLFIGSILVGLGGILFLSEATMGVGILAFAALLGIWSRIIQAAGNHRALLDEMKSNNSSTGWWRKWMIKRTVFLLLVAVFLAGCAGEAEVVTGEVEVEVTVEQPVTRIVEIPVTVEVESEVTWVVENQVTRIVEMPVTRMVTPTPTMIAGPGEDPSVIFAANYLGEATSNGVTVELLRVLFMHRDVFEPEQTFDDEGEFDGQEFVAEYIVRITNDSGAPIEWFSGDWFARVNDRQIALADYIFVTRLGESPIEPIFSDSSIITGLWFPTEGIAPDEVESFTLIIQPARNSDGGGDVTGRIEITADLSGEHAWEPLPEEWDE